MVGVEVRGVAGNHGNRVCTALATELPFLQMRLRASERTVELLKRKNTGRHHGRRHGDGAALPDDVISCVLFQC